MQVVKFYNGGEAWIKSEWKAGHDAVEPAFVHLCDGMEKAASYRLL